MSVPTNIRTQTTKMKKVYYYNEEILEDTIPSICEDYQEIPETAIRDLIHRIAEKEEINPEEYPEDYRSEVKDFIQYVTTKPLVDEIPVAALPPAPKARVDFDISTPQELLSAAAIYPLGEHFLLTEAGGIKINNSNPPSIEQAHNTFMDFYNITQLGDYFKDKTAWLLGEYIVACEDHFGEDFNPSQVIEITDRAYNTLYQASRVVRMFPADRRKNLSFSHHREVGMCAELQPGERASILKKGEAMDLTTKQTRDLCTLVKNLGPKVLDEIKTPDKIKEMKEEFDGKTVTYLYEVKPDLWKKTTKNETEPAPMGSTVINLTKMILLTSKGDVPISVE